MVKSHGENLARIFTVHRSAEIITEGKMWILIYVFESASSYPLSTGVAEFTTYANCEKAVVQVMQQKGINPRVAICVKK